MEFEVSAKLSSDMDKESQKKLKAIFKILFWVGIAGLLAYIVIGVGFFEEDEEPLWLEIMLNVSAVVFALGLVIPIVLNKLTKKNQSSIEGVINTYAFSEECVTVCSYRNNEKIAEVKNYYKEFTKLRKTERYVYLHLGLKGAYVLEKESLTDEQMAWLSTVIGKKNAA